MNITKSTAVLSFEKQESEVVKPQIPVYRSNKFDNLKGLLIFLVVLCHFFELFSGGVRYEIYMAVYTFHMPLFVFVSGYFAKFDIKRTVLKQIYPYIVFQLLFCALFTNKLQLHTPYWILWYMFCLAVWCLSLWFIKKHLPIWIAAAFATALVTGFFDGADNLLSLSRMVCFYPFFLLGVYFREKGIGMKEVRGQRVFGIFLTVLAALLTLVLLPHIKTNWLYHSASYAETGCTLLWRGGIFVLSLLWCIGLLLIMTEKHIPLLGLWGRYSICIYLLHAIVQRVFMYYINPFVFTEWINILLALLLTAAVCVCFGNKWVLYAVRPAADLTFFSDIFKKRKIKNNSTHYRE